MDLAAWLRPIGTFFRRGAEAPPEVPRPTDHLLEASANHSAKVRADDIGFLPRDGERRLQVYEKASWEVLPPFGHSAK